MAASGSGRTADDERIPILGELRGEVTVFERMVVREISRRGARVETHVPLQLNSLHQFRLTLGERSVVVRGRVAHCHLSDIASSGTVYNSGVEFLEMAPAVAKAIEEFLEAIKAARQGV